MLNRAGGGAADKAKGPRPSTGPSITVRMAGSFVCLTIWRAALLLATLLAALAWPLLTGLPLGLLTGLLVG